MTTGHCRHQWVPCSEALRDAFPRFVDEHREFRVCARCLRVEELAPVAVDLPAPAAHAAEERPRAA